MKIYNLFPLLAGRIPEWTPHLERAAAMGFDWIFINPIQRPGRSGSLYSIADYFAINERLVDPAAGSAEQQLKQLAAAAKAQGQSLMIDLVINHCAIDSPLVQQHPEWFVLKRGKPASPFCVEPDGSKTVWEDLAQFDHKKSKDRAGLLAYCVKIVDHLANLGFRGLRCDAAYQLPSEFWRELIEQSRTKHPDLVFVAETLGCSPKQTKMTASAGFDAIYNSAKWWDFGGDWLFEQYNLTRKVVGSISFPESHDTERLFAEMHDNVNALRQRYLFTALFASHIMMPIGYEYGFRRRLHVVNTRPEDWESPNVDLTDFIAHINGIKDNHPVLASEGRIDWLDYHNPAILVLRKQHDGGKDQALLIINKDPWNNQEFYCEDLQQLLGSATPLHDVSPDWPMEHLPAPFHFDLGPGVARVLVTE